ncbi:aliphatic sulfonate ABC transporter substrate-binding protein [Scytonema sp. NUACC21]
MLVPQNSPIKTVAELKGKKVAFQKGSSAHYMLLQLIEQAKLQYSDIEPVYLPPADARAAFVKGSIDAWSIWDPFYAAAERNANARVLIDGSNVNKQGGYYLASRKFADENQETIRAILEEIQQLEEWSDKNRDAVAETLSPVLGIDLDTMKKATNRKRFGVVPITEELIATQQKVADTFYNLKLIPKKIDVKEAMLKPEQYAALSPKV